MAWMLLIPFNWGVGEMEKLPTQPPVFPPLLPILIRTYGTRLRPAASADAEALAFPVSCQVAGEVKKA